MTNKELITKLKNKDAARAFGICSPEEQAVYKEVGKENCLYFSETGEWIEPAIWKNRLNKTMPCHPGFITNVTYVIFKGDLE